MESTTSLVMIIINTVLTALVPVITILLRRLEKSKCMGCIGAEFTKEESTPILEPVEKPKKKKRKNSRKTVEPIANSPSPV